jgi:predicted membrane protein
MRKILSFIVLAMVFMIPVMAEDDDDDIVTEIIIDLAVGIFIAVCETSATCTYFMYIVSIFVLFILLISCCINGSCNSIDECCTVRSTRRGLTNYAGYRLGKQIMG